MINLCDTSQHHLCASRSSSGKKAGRGPARLSFIKASALAIAQSMVLCGDVKANWETVCVLCSRPEEWGSRSRSCLHTSTADRWCRAACLTVGCPAQAFSECCTRYRDRSSVCALSLECLHECGMCMSRLCVLASLHLPVYEHAHNSHLGR